MNVPPRKVLILDGISGVPLGREVCEAFRALEVETIHWDCLRQKKSGLHGIRSAYAKALNRLSDGESFYFLPKLIEKDLEALLTAECPSHILVIGFAYKFYNPAILRQMADRIGAKLCLYDTDSCNLYSRRREFVFFVERELPVYDRIFSFSQVTTRFFKKTRSLDARHLPFGAQPIDVSERSESLDVLFVGSCDLRRIFLLENIADKLTVRGNRWGRNLPLISPGLRSKVIDKPAWGNELYQLLGNAKITLNITRSDFFGAETGVNLRIFEALAAGCFLLTDHCDEIAELFVIGKEIETFRSSRELAEKVEYFLAHKGERRQIAQCGYDSFLRNHTWQARMQTMIEQLPNN